MVRKLVLMALTLVAAVPAVAVAESGGGAGVRATPKTGSLSTRFVVSFTTPARSGRFGTFGRHYVVDATTRAGPSCVSSASAKVPDGPAHRRARVTLDPRRLGGTWCAGTFHGRIDEIQRPECPKGQPCPLYVTVRRRVAKFSVRVTAPPGRDSTPPTFAGLQSAFACTPGPQRPGQTTPFTLTWQPATDVVTPSAAIVYDVYMATTPGGEDFSKPTWTTPPGVTSFTTPGLASHGGFYFVVRAQDQAGNEDHNGVERRGVDPCY